MYQSFFKRLLDVCFGVIGLPFFILSLLIFGPIIALSDRGPVADDPRVTPIGRFMRATSIDEWPQVLNILNGTMSLIGPRPDPPDDMEVYTEEQKGKLRVRPGLTGYNQAYYRNSVGQDEKFEHDLYYANNISFGLDVRIFFKTIATVLFRQNVYNDASAPDEAELRKLGR